MARGQVHVVMLPSLKFGHMFPFLELSIALAKSGIHVSFLSTPKNIQRLQKIPQNLSGLIHLVPLTLPKLDSDLLPDDAEASVDLTMENVLYLDVAYDLLEQPVRNFIVDQSPDWLFLDYSPDWAIDIARDLNIPIIAYMVLSAATMVFYGPPEVLVEGEEQEKLRPNPQSFTYPPEWVNFPSNVAYKNHEALGAYEDLHWELPTGKTLGQLLSKMLQASNAIALRTCPEFEPEYFNLYTKISGKPVIPVGFLPPVKSEERELFTEEPWSGTFKWLDAQKPKSVVFVGFGSEIKLDRVQVQEIAVGLELSGLRFIWALRKPEWAKDDTDALPPGFRDRMDKRGVVSIGWAPQRAILAHPSIGATLFHAGWGSMIENLQHGHYLVVLPSQIFDQPLNARLLVEKGLALEVETGEDGSFSGDDIAKSLKKVIVSEEGEKYRVRAEEAAVSLFGNQKLQDLYVEKLVEFLNQNRTSEI